jgi:hypothetical protein
MKSSSSLAGGKLYTSVVVVPIVLAVVAPIAEVAMLVRIADHHCLPS